MPANSFAAGAASKEAGRTVKSIEARAGEADAGEEEEKVCMRRWAGDVRVGWGVGRWVVVRERVDWGFVLVGSLMMERSG